MACVDSTMTREQNRQRLAELHRTLDELAAQHLHADFSGEISLSFGVKAGTISGQRWQSGSSMSGFKN